MGSIKKILLYIVTFLIVLTSVNAIIYDEWYTPVTDDGVIALDRADGFTGYANCSVGESIYLLNLSLQEDSACNYAYVYTYTTSSTGILLGTSSNQTGSQIYFGDLLLNDTSNTQFFHVACNRDGVGGAYNVDRQGGLTLNQTKNGGGYVVRGLKSDANPPTGTFSDTWYNSVNNFYGFTIKCATAIPNPEFTLTIDNPKDEEVYGINQMVGNNSIVNITFTINETVETFGLNDSRFTLVSNTSTDYSYTNNTELTSGKYHIYAWANKTGYTNQTDNIVFTIDLENPTINGTFDNTDVTFLINITYIINMTDNINLTIVKINDSCQNNIQFILNGTTDSVYYTNETLHCGQNSQETNISVCDEINCITETYSWTLNGSFDNCSTYTTPFLNWTFYRSPNQKTEGDAHLNITCSDTNLNLVNVTLSSYYYDKFGGQMCGHPATMQLYCYGEIRYTGEFTNGWIYEYEFLNTNINSSVLNLNLTIPKLYLNFSSATDIQVITRDGVSYFYNKTILISMDELPVGKVSVVFNNGTQYFEYENNQNTFINENLKLLTNQDDFVNIKVQDTTFGVLDEAVVDIYEVNSVTNQTELINTLYGNNEKELFVPSTMTMVLKARLDGYEQKNGVTIAKSEETEGDDLIIIMRRNDSIKGVSVTKNIGNYIAFNTMSNNDYRIYVNVTTTRRSTILIRWQINDSGQIIPSSALSTYSHSANWLFTEGDGIHRIWVDIDGVSHTTYIIREADHKLLYEEGFYDTLLTSKVAFIVLLIITLIISVAVQDRHSNYGVGTATILSILFSFLNLYMLTLSIPLVIGAIGKKVGAMNL